VLLENSTKVFALGSPSQAASASMAASNARAQQGITAALDNKERSEALAQMHLTKILRAYIMQMITGTLEPVCKCSATSGRLWW
jgi:hypothetical protein